MRVAISIFAAVNVIGLVKGQREIVCKPRPGCRVAQCSSSLHPGSLTTDEYQMSCTLPNRKAPQHSNPQQILDQFSANTEEIARLNKELKKIQTEYSKLEQRLKSRDQLKNEINDLRGDYEELEKRVDLKLQPKPEPCEKPKVKDCFWTVTYPGPTINLTQARDICRENNSVAAMITNEETYADLIAFLRPTISRFSRWLNLWTGMVFNVDTMNITKPRKNFVKWVPGEPSEDPTHTGVTISIARQSEYSHQGASNYPPSLPRQGVICQVASTSCCYVEEISP